MKKGKFGLSLSAIAVIAFVFVALNQPVAVLLVVGFAFLAEKEEWLNRQVVQAMLLSVAYNLVFLVFDVFFGIFYKIFEWTDAYKASEIFSDIHSVINDLLFIVMILLVLISVIKVLSGRDAKLPLLYKMAGGDFTKALAKQAPVQQQPVQQQPVQQAPAQEAAAPATRFCVACGAKLDAESAFCSECGKKVN